jgi:hypothetical protein
VRRLVPAIADRAMRDQIVDALDAIDAAPDATAPEALRNGLFRRWQAAEAGEGRRVVWAAWMLLRELPGTTLRTARAVQAGELERQIESVAAALAW